MTTIAKPANVSVIFRPSSREIRPQSPAVPAASPPIWWHDEEYREWPPLEWPEEPIAAPVPSRGSIWLVRALILAGAISLAWFFIFLLEPEKRGDPWLFWPLLTAICYKALWWLVEWMNYARPKFEKHVPPKRQWTVDVLTTACPGEPRGMVLRTLLAMKAIRYPHTDYLCDEGDDPILKAACEVLDIRHVTRKVKKDAKAGNINNALQQATGEIAVVLDPDHEPAPYMLDRILGHFEDPKVGFVQSVQGYRNQKDSLVADGAAKQTYLFYGPVMIGMNAYGTTQAIGANCVFRRAALDSIGGHSTGLAEDMHTTIRLYSKKWRSVYVPELLTRGLVPSTLSAYCKQQIKWAFGSVELLFQVYPKVFGGMTWWQRLHYVMAPIYFLRGVFGAISIIIPIVALAFGGVPMRINLIEYLAAYLPVLILGTVIRQRTQKWTIEKSERGAHMVGGLLGTGCWFVFLQGVLCALFRVKLPYIPTPKENEAHDSWGLAIPNLIASALSIGAVIYGLNRDWTPYTWMMAAFALWNAAQLTFVAALGQQRTLERIAYFFARRDWLALLINPISKARFHIQCAVLTVMRERPGLVATFAVLVALALHFRPKTIAPIDTHDLDFKETGGFYVGARFSSAEEGNFPANFETKERSLGTNFRLLPFTRTWGPEEVVPFPRELMRATRLHGAVPLMTWEPKASNFPALMNDPALGEDRGVLTAVLNGTFDSYLTSFAEKVRDFGEPVLIRLAPEPDQPAKPWSASRGTPPTDYTEAWDYIVAIFNNVGATNVGWVWQPASADGFKTHFPSIASVDWVGVSALNRGKMGGGNWREFVTLYQPFRSKVVPLKLPVLVTDFASSNIGGDRRGWLRRGLEGIATSFSEIRGLVLTDAEKGWFADQSEEVRSTLAEGLARPELREAPPAALQESSTIWSERPRTAKRTGAIRGSTGKYELIVDGSPFYIQGVAYNPGHDWRDGFVPLTRRELETDFDRVRSFGVNTIRRYGSNWYDRNILKLADEKGLKVLFGFWFEQKIDYLTNAAKLQAYQTQVEETVRSRRGEHSIIAWGLGNEVWGLLKHRYSQPYLTEVRHAHVDFIEGLARRIHELDPERPVYVAHEHAPQIAGSLADFARGAPSLDFTAVNSYYEERMSQLARVATRMDPTRPYLISEFGPDGYWETRQAQRSSFGALLEPSTEEKVHSYERGWQVHTLENRGANIGAVAYCWRDRYEATATWFGLTDPDGRVKPAGLAMKRLWTGLDPGTGPRVLSLKGPTDSVLPGTTVEFSATVTPSSGAAPQDYSWRLASEDFDFKVGKVTPMDGQPRARITLPRKPGTYRVYFAVNSGSLTDEANLPVQVSQGVSADVRIPIDWTSFPLMRRVVGP